MQRLTVKRVRFNTEIDNRLRYLKSKTGITPNILCRMGFCLSLEEPGTPSLDTYPEGTREINRYTLTGPFDEVLELLLRQRLSEDDPSSTDLDGQFVAHMNRGVVLLSARVRSLTDISGLLG